MMRRLKTAPKSLFGIKHSEVSGPLAISSRRWWGIVALAVGVEGSTVATPVVHSTWAV